MDEFKEKRRYWNLEEEEELNCTVWRTRFGRRYGPDVRQIMP
jgi:hypothetical protein